MWLIIVLAVTFSIAAAVWVGSIARQTVFEQHVRRLSLETEQMSSDMGQALAARLDAVRASGRILRGASIADRPSRLSNVFDELMTAYPQLDWIAIADSNGAVIGTNGALQKGINVSAAQWFSTGLKGPWLGVIESADRRQPSAVSAAALGDLATPVRDEAGIVVGVVTAHLSWRRAAHHLPRLTDEADSPIATQAFVLDRDEIVLLGPKEMRGKTWSGVPKAANGVAQSSTGSLEAIANAPQFETLPAGQQVLISRAPLSATNEISALGWQVQLSEPNERVYQRADAVAIRIIWV
jgi:hypothetical protein